MDFFKKMVIVIVLISFFGLQFPRTGFAEQDQSHGKTAEGSGITRHDPEFLAPSEVVMPPPPEVETPSPNNTLKKWLWIGLGAVAVAGVAAAAGGGGGGGGGSTPSGGDITIKWNE